MGIDDVLRGAQAEQGRQQRSEVQAQAQASAVKDAFDVEAEALAQELAAVLGRAYQLLSGTTPLDQAQVASVPSSRRAFRKNPPHRRGWWLQPNHLLLCEDGQLYYRWSDYKPEYGSTVRKTDVTPVSFHTWAVGCVAAAHKGERGYGSQDYEDLERATTAPEAERLVADIRKRLPYWRAAAVGLVAGMLGRAGIQV